MKTVSLFLLFFVLSAATFAQNDGAFKPGTGAISTDTIPPVGFPYNTQFNFNYSGIAGMNGGSAGVIFHAGKFHFFRWNGTTFYRYNGNGVGGGPSTLADTGTYAGSLRDFTSDGNFLYGGNSTTGVLKLDPVTLATVQTITLTGGSTRAIAYDATRNGIWNTGFGGNIFLHDMSGVLKQTITSTLTGKYGLAFDSIPGQPAYLWVWNQVTGGANASLEKISIATGATLNTYSFTYTGPNVGIAGGAEICMINGKRILLLNFQNQALVGYELGGIVPVEFTAFSASTRENDVVLNWSTATEKNNYGFEVLRKSGNGDYQRVSFIPGNGTSTTTQNYSYVDKNVAAGNYSYRLRQLDFDGSYAYSSIVEVDLTAPLRFNLAQNFPNPFNPATTISFNLAVDSKVSIKIFNTLGQEVSVLTNADYTAGTHNINFNAAGFTSGIYYYTIDAVGQDGKNYSSTKKMTLNK